MGVVNLLIIERLLSCLLPKSRQGVFRYLLIRKEIISKCKPLGDFVLVMFRSLRVVLIARRLLVSARVTSISCSYWMQFHFAATIRANISSASFAAFGNRGVKPD